MTKKISLLLLGSVLVLSACASREKPAKVVYLYPPASDLQEIPEPEVPPAATATYDSYESYNNAILAWGRSYHDAMARLREWIRQTREKLSRER